MTFDQLHDDGIRRSARTIPAKYIFLDVVSFSHGRSVEAQTDIVHSLNEIVKRSLTVNNIAENRRILLPTGDGICVALLNIEEPYDVHMLIASDIVRSLEEYNRTIDDETRRFKVRIGLNANIDNLVTDINNNQNIAGRGINMAQRIMAMADGNQILIGESVFEVLHVRETYMKFFRNFPPVRVKHESIRMYQFIDESRSGLDTNVPELLKPNEQKPDEPKLSFQTACYFAQAIKYREFLIQQRDVFLRPKIIFLWMHAKDLVHEIESKGLTAYVEFSYRAGKAEPIEQLEFYSKLDFGVYEQLFEFIQTYLTTNCGYEYFDEFNLWLINEKGKDKLKKEWPDIWHRFNFEKIDNNSNPPTRR
ncbi:MAG TPA: adenylate/guanylate cyclase domain-containing protein [Pyrinomonadaceae bacterium]